MKESYLELYWAQLEFVDVGLGEVKHDRCSIAQHSNLSELCQYLSNRVHSLKDMCIHIVTSQSIKRP